MQISVGVDDTDSPRGGCTTYLAATLIPKLEELGAKFIDYPLLVRLNPNTPWKTRGNGAVCLRLEAPLGSLPDIERLLKSAVEAMADFDCENTNPGVVIHCGKVTEEMEGFYEDALHEIMEIREAEELIEEISAVSLPYKNGRGLVGALAAIGATLKGDHTYELLTYRAPENSGNERRLDDDSIRAMDGKLRGCTFSSVDHETGQILIAPRGPDPVLYGVRGETPEAVYEAMKLIKPLEPVERWVIYRSNQGTGVHLRWREKIGGIKPRHQVVLEGSVSQPPKTTEGGHVFFRLDDGSGEAYCAAYEPSKEFRRTVEQLRRGDKIEVAGGVREADEGLTLNIEYLRVESLTRVVEKVNPRCPRCEGSTESMGTGQGFRCRKCGEKLRGEAKMERVVLRSLKPGLYLPPPRAERHLTRPEARQSRVNTYSFGSLYSPWHS